MQGDWNAYLLRASSRRTAGVFARHRVFAGVLLCCDRGQRTDCRALCDGSILRSEPRLAQFSQAIQPGVRLRSLPSAEDVVMLKRATKRKKFMNLTPREKDKLMIALAATVAPGRLARGVNFNYPETAAVKTDFLLAGRRDGNRVAELMSGGGKILTHHLVMQGT